MKWTNNVVMSIAWLLVMGLTLYKNYAAPYDIDKKIWLILAALCYISSRSHSLEEIIRTKNKTYVVEKAKTQFD